MVQKRITTKNSDAMMNVAAHYASELDAQFRTLNHFTSHSSEIGRVHETFLRGLLSRFMPKNIRVSSGFVASPNWVSSQQDILIHEKDYSSLFEVGDCVVIDYKSFIGTIEVKTIITSQRSLLEAIRKQSEFREQMRHRGLYAIYAWDGINSRKMLEALFNFISTDPHSNYDLTPDVIYIRGKYFLMANRDGHIDTSPYYIWHIRNGCIDEGQALLGLISSVWSFGMISVLPWWLLGWHKQIGKVSGKAKEIKWPKTIKDLMKL